MAQQVRREGKELVGVYGDEASARLAARRAEEAGAPPARIGSDRDHVVALQAEMKEELDEGFVLPQAAMVFPKESAKGVAWTLPIAVVVGVVLITPLGFVEIGETSLALRLVAAALIGATMGGVFAFIAGAGVAARGRFEANAADRGVTVRVASDDEAVERAMASADPIRLDRVHPDGTPDTVVTTEEHRPGEGTAETIAEHLEDAPHVAGKNDESLEQ